MISFKKTTLSISVLLIMFIFNVTNVQGYCPKEDTLIQSLSENKLSNELYNEGLKEYRNGNTNSSIKKLVKAIKLDDGFSQAHYMVSKILSEKDDAKGLDYAKRAIDKAIELNPDEELYQIHYEKLMQKARIYDYTKTPSSSGSINCFAFSYSALAISYFFCL